MEYLFLKRKRTTATSVRQRALLFKAAERHWEEEFAHADSSMRKIDCDIYKGILYLLEIRQAFLDPDLSLKKLSEQLETNQTYISNAVNRYFGCNLKELLNTYRVEYAKELLRSGRCSFDSMPSQCGFASKSAFYAAFNKRVGISPSHYVLRERRNGEVMAVSSVSC